MKTGVLRNIFLVICFLFICLWIGLLYWQMGRNDLKNHPFNPRNYQIFFQQRGSILDRNREILAKSTESNERYERIYSAPQSLTHIVGYFHPRYGMTGLEKEFHIQLSKQNSIITTLDINLQNKIEQLISDKVGAVVAVNPSTGQILSLVSSPTLDGNNLTENWNTYLNNPNKPFVNRSLEGLYPPGSIIKPLILAAAYEENILDKTTMWEDRGSITFNNRVISNYSNQQFGIVTNEEALALSVNTVFSTLANSLKTTILDYFKLFGIGSSVSIELNKKVGNLPQPYLSSYGWAQLGIGQGELLITPFEAAIFTAIIANKGVMMKPYLIRETISSWFGQVQFPQVVRRVISEKTALLVSDAMISAVDIGTAKEVQVQGIQIAGKTGTAEVSGGQAHSWFIGFAPAHNPEIALTAIIEHGGTGAESAVPIAREIFRYTLGNMEER